MRAEVMDFPKRDDKSKKIEVVVRQTKKSLKKVPSMTPELLENKRIELEHLAREREALRLEAVMDGKGFLTDFLRYHFEDQFDNIRIISKLTLEEIKMIGNEENINCGVRQCRRLFNAPVLSDQVGYLLWRELRQGNALDHSHKRMEDGASLQYNNVDDTHEQRTSEETQGADFIDLAVSIHISPQIERSRSGLSHDGSLNSGQASSPSSTKTSETKADQIQPPPMEERLQKRKADCFMGDFKKHTLTGAGYFAASLARGYCL
ncbi:hypothetical protein F5Y19DRAFT_473628 [Xylariaceae sp. FL1651]|nr:hypothetical protein F5Y19DRAFT_473628 [Xylariaceae sp. FL1651]